MMVKSIVEEDFVNYKVPSMFIAMGTCDYKCCREAGVPIETCQNHELHMMSDILIPEGDILKRYITNNITEAIVLGGLDPMNSFGDTLSLIESARLEHGINDDIVIYTGYTKEELHDEILILQQYPNIVMKFGRYVPGRPSRFDEVLGVTLASDNQYAERIS